MARIPRKYLVDLASTNHCIFRGHNMIRLFSEDDVAEKFLALLAKYKNKYGILIQSYCLMPTHAHLVVTALQGQEAFSKFLQVVNHGIACGAEWVKDKLLRLREQLKSPLCFSG